MHARRRLPVRLLLFFCILLCAPTCIYSTNGKVKKSDGFDHLLLSFPKSGRTWLRYMLARTFDLHFGIKALFGEKEERYQDALMRPDLMHKKEPRVPFIAIDHCYNNLEFEERDQWQLPEVIVDSSIILLVRDPRDACVSNFFQKRYRDYYRVLSREGANNCYKQERLRSPKFEYQGKPFCDSAGQNCSCFPLDYTVRDWMYEPRGGLETTAHYNAFMYNNRHRMRQMLLVRYEDLKVRPIDELYRIMLFVGVTTVSNETLRAVAEESSFEAMREKERTGAFGLRLSPVDENDTLTYKTRAGKVGGYLDFFGDDAPMLAWMQEVIDRIVPVELGYSSASVPRRTSRDACDCGATSLHLIMMEHVWLLTVVVLAALAYLFQRKRSKVRWTR